MKKYYHFLFIISLFFISFAKAQTRISYKKIDTTVLSIEVYSPSSIDTNKHYPAMVFFFGGGWVEGTINQFLPQAQYLSQRGMVCFLVDYRVFNRHKTTPFDALKDAKSAMRFIKGNADKFHIDTNKIVASGGSAGGHLAAATALIKAYNDSSDNIAISPVPNALVLFNPVIDNGPNGYGYERIKEAYKDFSPMHNIKSGAPPTIIFLGTKDNLIPVETVQLYKKEMEKVNSRCEVFLFEGQGHGFFNYKKFENYKQTLLKTDEFLQSLGYLSKEPVIEIK